MAKYGRGRPKIYKDYRVPMTVRLSRERNSRIKIMTQAAGLGSMNEWFEKMVDQEWNKLVESKRA